MNAAMDRPPANHGQIMWGILIAAAGVLMLVDRLDLAHVRLSSRLWPLFPLALGLLRFIDPPLSRAGGTRSRRSGAWLLFVGGWGLANELGLYGLTYESSWPLIIMFAGVTIVWRAVEQPAAAARVERRDA